MSQVFRLNVQAQALQALFNAATHVRWPAHLGTGTEYDLIWDDQQRAEKMFFISAFRKTVREKYATRVGSEWRTGNAKNWQPKSDNPSKFELLEPTLEIPLELEVEAHNAIYWLSLWMAHPASPGFVTGGLLDEVIYPLISGLGALEDFLYDLGLRHEEPKESTIREREASAPRGLGTGNGNS